jgi:hypothetical protein
MLFKRADNQPLDRVTLKDTGDLYRSFKVEREKLAIEIKANIIKEDGESIAENFLTTYFPDEFYEEITGLSNDEFKIILNSAMDNVKRNFI